MRKEASERDREEKGEARKEARKDRRPDARSKRLTKDGREAREAMGGEERRRRVGWKVEIEGASGWLENEPAF